MFRDIATHLYRRAVADHVTKWEIPAWAWAVFFLDFIVFLPFVLTIGYTFNNLFPVLAMVEDPSPPAYEPVSLNADTESVVEHDAQRADESARGSQETRAISASFRALHRTVYGISGVKSYFRGFACWVALCFSTLLVYGIIQAIPVVPDVVAAMISAVALVQLYAAWLHVAISAPSAKPFWQRLPAFKKAFQACALPTVIYFLALEFHSKFPKFLAHLMGMTKIVDSSNLGEVPQPSPSDAWKGLIVFIVAISITIFVTIPAHVVLTRVQASLLPEEDETIVPFDRSFQGKLVPAIVGGSGFVTIKDAWQTFSRASWIRLVKLYLKIFAISLAIYFVMALIMIPEAFAIVKNSRRIE